VPVMALLALLSPSGDRLLFSGSRARHAASIVHGFLCARLSLLNNNNPDYDHR